MMKAMMKATNGAAVTSRGSLLPDIAFTNSGA